MKKLIYIIFAFISIGMQAQTANGTETKQQAFRSLNPQTVTSVNFLTSMGTDGTMGKINPINLPIPTLVQNALDLKVSKTGEGFNYAIDFDDVLSQNSSLLIGKRTIKPEATRIPIANTTILGWGDSLTEANSGNGSYLYHINALTGFTTVNKGAAGETSTSIKNRFITDAADYDKTVIIWAGRNNYASPATVKADIATMVAALTHTRYLVLGIVNGDFPSEYINQPNWVIINQLNADLKAIYGKRFLDIRTFLVSQHDQTAQDLIDFANDVPPTSLRSDPLHQNVLGAQKEGEYINRYLGVLLGQEEYLQSKDFKYYANLYDNYLHTSGNEIFTGKKSSTNTTNPFTNGFDFINSGPANSKSENFVVSGGGYGSDYTITGTSTGNRFTVTAGTGSRYDVAASQMGVQVVSTGAGSSNFRNTINGSGFGVRSDNNSTGYAYYGVNAVGGIYDFAQNNSTGVLKQLESSTASTGDLLRFTKNGSTTLKFDQNGVKTLVNSPTTSAGGYEFYTRNTTSGAEEKIPSANVQGTITATTSADYYRGDKTFQPLNSAVIGSVLTGFSAGAGTVASTDTVLQGFNKLAGNQAFKANLASPALTGVPTTPTATAGTNTTQVANTIFVNDAISTAISASSADIQDIVDAPTKVALIDGGNSQITMFDGSTDNRTFSGIISNGTGDSSDFNFQNTNCFIRSEVSGYSGLIGVSSGLPRILRTKSGVGTTEIGIEEPVASTTINTPALSVGGTYIYEVQPKEYLVSALPTPTGSDTRFAIVTDALAPSYMVTIVGGGSVVCPVFFDGVSWKAH